MKTLQQAKQDNTNVSGAYTFSKLWDVLEFAYPYFNETSNSPAVAGPTPATQGDIGILNGKISDLARTLSNYQESQGRTETSRVEAENQQAQQIAKIIEKQMHIQLEIKESNGGNPETWHDFDINKPIHDGDIMLFEFAYNSIDWAPAGLLSSATNNGITDYTANIDYGGKDHFIWDSVKPHVIHNVEKNIDIPLTLCQIKD